MIVALCGNQNAGKTTLFNLLTGAAEHVGNYPGVTVEQRVGRLLPAYQQGANAVQIVDLPGVYSLTPYSREEAVTREYILREKPDIVIQVLDVTSLQRGLYLTLELMALGRPLVLALNMTEALAKSGGMLDVQRLQARLGVPCISINARTGRGARQLMAAAMQAAKAGKAPASPVPFPLESLPAPEHRKLAQARYDWIDRCLAVCLTLPRNPPRLPPMDWLFSNRLLSWPILAALVLAVLFIAFGSPGQTLTHLFEVLIEQAGLQIDALLARAGTAPLLRDLLINGAFAGVGAVVSFLPAILLLFLLIGLLEDSGLMARVAMALDAPMRRLGLSGRSFVPLMKLFTLKDTRFSYRKESYAAAMAPFHRPACALYSLRSQGAGVSVFCRAVSAAIWAAACPCAVSAGAGGGDACLLAASAAAARAARALFIGAAQLPPAQPAGTFARDARQNARFS